MPTTAVSPRPGHRTEWPDPRAPVVVQQLIAALMTSTQVDLGCLFGLFRRGITRLDRATSTPDADEKRLTLFRGAWRGCPG